MSEWVSKPLGKTVTFQKGRKVETSAEELPGYLRYLGAGSLVGKNDGYASTVNAVRATSKDVLMLWDGERSGLVGYNLEGVVSSTVSKLATLGEVTAPYLYYFLSRNFEWIQNRRTGTGVPHVPKDLGRIMSVDFPKCEDTQKQITTILQAIDEAIEQTKALIEKYSLVKAGMMNDLFTRGLTPDGKLRPPREEAPDLYKETPIGWIPKEWEPKPLDAIATYQHGRPFPSTDYSSEGVLLLRPGNLHASGFVVFDDAHRTRIPIKWVKIAAAFIVKDGDILMNLTAQSLDDEFLGRVCRFEGDEPALLNQRIARFKPRDVESDFLYWILKCREFRRQIDNTSQGTKVQHLYNRDLDRVLLGVPSKPEERIGIANVLGQSVAKIRNNEANLQKLKLQKSGLMHDLLTGEVPVYIDEPEAANV